MLFSIIVETKLTPSHFHPFMKSSSALVFVQDAVTFRLGHCNGFLSVLPAWLPLLNTQLSSQQPVWPLMKDNLSYNRDEAHCPLASDGSASHPCTDHNPNCRSVFRSFVWGHLPIISWGTYGCHEPLILCVWWGWRDEEWIIWMGRTLLLDK